LQAAVFFYVATKVSYSAQLSLCDSQAEKCGTSYR
jgi:hypothetical protein